MFEEIFKGLSREFQGCFNEDRGCSKRSSILKGASQRHFKEVSGVLQSVKRVSRKFQNNFKGVSRMFNEVWFPLLFLHGSHRSYPCRRRALNWSDGKFVKCFTNK